MEVDMFCALITEKKYFVLKLKIVRTMRTAIARPKLSIRVLRIFANSEGRSALD